MINSERFIESFRRLARKINLKKPLAAKEIKQILEEQYTEKARRVGIIANTKEKP